MKQSLWLPNYRPPTLNQIMRGHLRTRMKLGNECHQMVGTYAVLQSIVKADGKRRVSLQIVLKGRQREADADALLKSTFDALVACGMLVDDTVQYVEWGGVTYARIGEPGTTIVLEDLP